ncbi:ABC transporter ATP-binding protein [Belliella sp. R4-6]|uniref:ABC transporter ATP-binding protein n=1 Tax=Belliella alkalica TaxID=1730871 RepID=A0ABS9VG83_9BACT|nr:ABC transporter ATP-binding protein [Belliella alkalica]MCH7415454.1 ABC transporter ATP-binding protein [Belliella alkalica]
MIEINKINKRYKGTYALQSISLKIELDGKIYGLVGPNGSGKTSLISILSGFINSDSGTISGVEKNSFGSFIGTESFLDHLTVYEWLYFIQQLKNKTIDDSEINELITLLNMGEESNKKIKSLSYGRKQRLGIISAIIGKPKLVIFDEPLNGLDPSGVFLFKKTISWLVDHKISVLYSSHRLDDLANYCNHLFLLNRGKLLFDGDFESFIQLGNGNIEESYNSLVV